MFYVPLVMLACATWAVLPKMIGALCPPLGRVLRIPILGDVFFFYAFISRIEDEGSAWGLMAVLAMWLVVVLAYIRHIRRITHMRQSGG